MFIGTAYMYIEINLRYFLQNIEKANNVASFSQEINLCEYYLRH